MISAKVIADSINPAGVRIITYQLRYMKWIHGEEMTHKMLSKCASSSRAKPIEKVMAEIENDPAMPLFWGENQKGMQARKPLVGQAKERAREKWLRARDACLVICRQLQDEDNLHKQLSNRITEPWVHIDVIVTSCLPGLENFFALRREIEYELPLVGIDGVCSPSQEWWETYLEEIWSKFEINPQPEMFALASAKLAVTRMSTPRKLEWGEWHLPFVTAEERVIYTLEEQLHRSVACCARTSYSNHDKTIPNVKVDGERYTQLASLGHWSPFEMQAQADKSFFGASSGNFEGGWNQLRKTFPNERRSFKI